MSSDLQAIKVALAELSDVELHALIEATHGPSRLAPDLLAWIEAACGWELSRRARLNYDLRLPDAPIPLEKDAITVGAANWLRSKLPAGHRTRAMLSLLYALEELLTGGERKH